MHGVLAVQKRLRAQSAVSVRRQVVDEHEQVDAGLAQRDVVAGPILEQATHMRLHLAGCIGACAVLERRPLPVGELAHDSPRRPVRAAMAIEVLVEATGHRRQLLHEAVLVPMARASVVGCDSANARQDAFGITAVLPDLLFEADILSLSRWHGHCSLLSQLLQVGPHDPL